MTALYRLLRWPRGLKLGFVSAPDGRFPLSVALRALTLPAVSAAVVLKLPTNRERHGRHQDHLHRFRY